MTRKGSKYGRCLLLLQADLLPQLHTCNTYQAIEEIHYRYNVLTTKGLRCIDSEVK